MKPVRSRSSCFFGAELGLCVVLLVGCGEVRSEPGAAAGGAGAASAVGSGAGPSSGSGGDSAAPCVENAIELELTVLLSGDVHSQVIPVRHAGEDAYLAIDTGAPLTFLYGAPGGPAYVEHAADVEIGCETYPVASLVLEAVGPEPFNGKTIVGIVGMDFFSEVPTEIDYPGRRVVRHLDGALPTEELFEVAVEWTGDRVIVDASLDEEPVRLIYDAGSPDTVWVGEQGRPGDEEVVLGTADGSTTPAFAGSVLLGFADDEAITVPVLRVPSFPYLEEELHELGAAGLLGASGLGFRRIGFDLTRARMWLGPRGAP